MINFLIEYALEPTETERVMANPLYIMMFRKPQIMIPTFKKIIMFSLFLNFLIVFMYICYFVVSKNLDKVKSDLQIGFSIYLFILSFVSTFLEIAITLYIQHYLKSQYQISALKRGLRKLLVSRIYVIYSNIETINRALQIIFSIVLLQTIPTKIQNFHVLFAINFIVCAIYFIRQIWSIKIYQSSFLKKQPKSQIQKLLLQMKLKNYNTNDQLKYNDCKICFENFIEQEQIVELNCQGRHIFHQNCVQNWFIHKFICPICKKLN